MHAKSFLLPDDFLLPWYLKLLCYFILLCPFVAMAPHLLQAYTPTNVSPSIDVWAFGIIATKVFLGRNLDKQRRDVRMHGL